MKKHTLSKLTVILLALCPVLGTSTAHSGSLIVVPSPTPIPSPTIGSVTMSLTTNGYRFFPGINGNQIAITAGTIIRTQSAFTAAVSLSNLTGENITFQFPTPVDASLKFVFRVYDAKDNLIWASNAGLVAPQVIANATLAKQTVWRKSVSVPLVINGKVLAPGQYRLEALVNGTPEFGANTTFVVGPVPGSRFDLTLAQ